MQNTSKTVKFIINGIVLTLTALLMRTVSLSFNAFITKKVGAECIGLFSLIMGVYGFAVTLATSGVNLGCTRMVSGYLGTGDRQRAGESFIKCMTYAAFFGTVSSALLFCFSEPIGVFMLGDERTVVPMRVLAVSLLPTALASCLNGYFTAIRQPAKNACTQIFEECVRIFVMTYLIMLMMPSGIEYAVLALVLGGTVTEIVSFLFLFTLFLINRRKNRTKRPIMRKETTKEMLKITLPVAMSMYVRSLLLTVEHILIPKRLMKGGQRGNEALASYGALHGMAMPIVLYPFAFIGSFASLLIPEVSESYACADRARIRRITERAIRYTLFFAMGAAGIMIVFSMRLGMQIYSSAEAGVYIAMIAPVVPVMYLDTITDSILKGIGEQVYSMGVNISDSLISIALVWFLLPIYGAKGYALVIVAAEIYNFSLSIMRLYAKTGFRIKIMKTVFFPLALSVGVCNIGRILFADCEQTKISLFLHIAICFLTYAVLWEIITHVFLHIRGKKETAL